MPLYVAAVVTKDTPDKDGELVWGPEPIMARTEKMAEYKAVLAAGKERVSEGAEVLVRPF